MRDARPPTPWTRGERQRAAPVASSTGQNQASSRKSRPRPLTAGLRARRRRGRGDAEHDELRPPRACTSRPARGDGAVGAKTRAPASGDGPALPAGRPRAPSAPPAAYRAAQASSAARRAWSEAGGRRGARRRRRTRPRSPRRCRRGARRRWPPSASARRARARRGRACSGPAARRRRARRRRRDADGPWRAERPRGSSGRASVDQAPLATSRAWRAPGRRRRSGREARRNRASCTAWRPWPRRPRRRPPPTSKSPDVGGVAHGKGGGAVEEGAACLVVAGDGGGAIAAARNNVEGRGQPVRRKVGRRPAAVPVARHAAGALGPVGTCWDFETYHLPLFVVATPVRPSTTSVEVAYAASKPEPTNETRHCLPDPMAPAARPTRVASPGLRRVGRTLHDFRRTGAGRRELASTLVMETSLALEGAGPRAAPRARRHHAIEAAELRATEASAVAPVEVIEKPTPRARSGDNGGSRAQRRASSRALDALRPTRAYSRHTLHLSRPGPSSARGRALEGGPRVTASSG